MCVKTIVTCTLYVICIATVAAAISFVGLGSALTAGLESYMKDILSNLVEDQQMKDFYLAAVYIMLAVGVMLFFTAFVGCWGACCHSECYLLMFNITTGIIVLMVMASGGLSFAFKDALSDDEQQIQTNFSTQVRDVYYVGDQDVTKSWDKMQSELSCCGTESYIDWITSAYYTNTRNEVPPSCCVKYNGNITTGDFNECKGEAIKSSPNEDILHVKACYFAFNEDAVLNADLLIGISFSFGILNLIAVLVGCCLKGKIEDD